ncbi:MAG: hypothetical protein EAX96_07315 [Candidatus Lokiarchaeota archaeon]|nr:hypothetical protein [Candidatus Lokiarchaeota archaeon]
MTTNFITLLTDFGTSSYYVASMKGIILKINPDVIIVDISHSIESFNLISAAYVLNQSYKNFPKGTIHVIVVDPGVGTKRRPILIQTEDYYFIGPDNGVFTFILNENMDYKILELTNRKYMNKVISSTFHGRDIFAPVASHLSLIKKIEKFGPIIENPIKISLNLDDINREFQIMHIDKFGNLVTSLKGDVFKKNFKLDDEINIQITSVDKKLNYNIPFKEYYGEVPEKSLLLLIGSSEFLEIASNKGNAKKQMNLKGNELIKIVKS